MGKFRKGDTVSYIGEMNMTLSQRNLPLHVTLEKGVTLTVANAIKTPTGYILEFDEILPWLPEALFTLSTN